MKVALVAVARNENQYINEFINHYINIGINHIYIYDNNFDGEQNIYDVLTNNNFNVTIINKRNDNSKFRQNTYFTEAYYEFGNLYDYIMFCDIDEFLYFSKNSGVNTINEYIYNYFYGSDAIYINWLCYDDNDLILNDYKPLKERFTRISEKGFTNEINYGVKSIVKTKLNLNFINPHIPHFLDKNNYIVYHGGCGDKLDVIDWCTYRYNYRLAHIKHYSGKTLEEFINRKIKIKSYEDFYGAIDINIYKFFDLNKINDIKIQYIKDRNIEFNLSLIS